MFEGHVNALFLVHLFGSREQERRYLTLARGGALFGVWNTDLRESPVVLGDGFLHGQKSFASGADGLNYALVTASAERGRQMAVVAVRALPIDRSWWHPLGMRASGVCIVDFDGVPVEDDCRLGGPDDYLKEPWFSAGAIRFAAVQVGGMYAGAGMGQSSSARYEAHVRPLSTTSARSSGD